MNVMKTLQHHAEQLIHWRQAQNASARTVEELGYYLKAFVRWLGETCMVHTADRLSPGHVRGYQTALAARTNRRSLPLRPGYLNNHIWAVRMLLGWLYEQGLTHKDLSVHIVSVKEPELLPTSVLTHAQVRRLLRSIDTTTQRGYRDRTILELLYSCGIRCGELLTLTLADVDFDARRLKVTGKGSKERMVPVGRTAARCLETYVKAIRPLWRGAREHQALFLNQYGRPLREQSLQIFVKRCAARLFPDIHVTPHTFRRSCTTEMIRAGANLYHVKDMLGHARLDSLKPYTKLTIVDLQRTHAKCHPRERDEQHDRG